MLETRMHGSRFQHIVVKNKKGDDNMLDEVIHQKKFIIILVYLRNNPRWNLSIWVSGSKWF
jgi:predicted RNA-binding protein with PUA domain